MDKIWKPIISEVTIFSIPSRLNKKFSVVKYPFILELGKLIASMCVKTFGPKTLILSDENCLNKKTTSSKNNRFVQKSITKKTKTKEKQREHPYCRIALNVKNAQFGLVMLVITPCEQIRPYFLLINYEATFERVFSTICQV